MKFYPAALDGDFEATHAPGKPVTQIVAPLRIDLENSGTEDYLAVAYSNGLAAALRIIKGTSLDTAVLVAEAKERLLGGDGRPTVSAVDVENDGVPELVVGFARSSWLYKYKNGNLVLVGPSRSSEFGLQSDLGDITFMDLDGDGILELLEIVRRPSTPYIIFKLDGTGHFVQQSYAGVFADRFERADGQPAAVSRPFAAAAGQNYTLRVINGDQAKKSIVTSAIIKLNGAAVLGPDDFTKGQRSFSVPVTLADDTTLSVELRGDPDSTLSVTITKP